jgi:hypothetical protein
MSLIWKENREESKTRYIDWWAGGGLIISMWEHLFKDGTPYTDVPEPPAPKDLNQRWFDPEWRADHLHWQMSRNSYEADILPIANTQLGPGSLAAILGADLEAGPDTIWIRHKEGFGDDIGFDPENRWWKLHLDLVRACKQRAQGRYLVGCPDLVEGLDTLAALKGNEEVLMDTVLRPEMLEEQVQKINDIYFDVFDRIYDIINEGGESAFCYFSLWAPGKVSKLQSDISIMISSEDFRRFVQPYVRQQCQRIDYTLYHLDGVGAIRHLDALLEIDELNAIQWTPGVGEPQGGDPKWFDLYRRIRRAGKSVMASWVTLDELEPLLDRVGAEGMSLLMDFKTETDVDRAMEIAEKYR